MLTDPSQVSTLEILDDSSDEEEEEEDVQSDRSVSLELNEADQLHLRDHTRSTYTPEEQRIVEIAAYLRVSYCFWLIFLVPATIALTVGVILDNTKCDTPIALWAYIQLVLQIYILSVKSYSFAALPVLGSRPSVEDINNFKNSFRYKCISVANRFCYIMWVGWFATGTIWVIEAATGITNCQLGILFDICLSLLVIQIASLVLLGCAFCCSCLYIVLRIAIIVVRFLITGNLPHGIHITSGASKSLIRSSTKLETFTTGLLAPDNMTCSICLEDYTEGDKIRILPCSDLHHFHVECVDPWLMSNKSCPLCKRTIDEDISNTTTTDNATNVEGDDTDYNDIDSIIEHNNHTDSNYEDTQLDMDPYQDEGDHHVNQNSDDIYCNNVNNYDINDDSIEEALLPV